MKSHGSAKRGCAAESRGNGRWMYFPQLPKRTHDIVIFTSGSELSSEGGFVFGLLFGSFPVEAGLAVVVREVVRRIYNSATLLTVSLSLDRDRRAAGVADLRSFKWMMLIYLLFIRVAQVDDGQNEHFLPFRFAQSEQSQRASPPKRETKNSLELQVSDRPSEHCRSSPVKPLQTLFPVASWKVSSSSISCRAIVHLLSVRALPGLPVVGRSVRRVLSTGPLLFFPILRPQIIPRSSSLRSTVKPPFMLAALLAIVHCWNGALC
jgi:hypothetical protein